MIANRLIQITSIIDNIKKNKNKKQKETKAVQNKEKETKDVQIKNNLNSIIYQLSKN
jgi:hypothetical protein